VCPLGTVDKRIEGIERHHDEKPEIVMTKCAFKKLEIIATTNYKNERSSLNYIGNDLDRRITVSIYRRINFSNEMQCFFSRKDSE
jgi:hypothetical protein